MADMMEVPAPDDVISSSAEFKEWLFKVVKEAIEMGVLTHVADAPIQSIGQFEMEDTWDADAKSFAISFGDSDEEAGELPIQIGPILYYDDYSE